MNIHIETPDFTIIEASDLGAIKAATALAKCCGDNLYHFVVADQVERFAIVQKRAKTGKVVTIKPDGNLAH